MNSNKFVIKNIFNDKKLDNLKIKYWFFVHACAENEVTPQSQLTFKTSSLMLKTENYFQLTQNSKCNIDYCSITYQSCSTLKYKFDDKGNLDAESDDIKSFNNGNSPCKLQIDCKYKHGNVQYSKSVNITIISTQSSCIYNSNYQLTHSSSLDFIYSKQNVNISETRLFNFDQSPSNSCDFSLCYISTSKSKSDIYNKTQFINTFTSNALNITNQTFTFQVDLSSAQYISFYYGCYVPSLPADTEFEVYSINQFKILVCDYTTVSQTKKTLNLNLAGQVIFPNELLKPSYSNCTLSSCYLYDSSTNTKQTNSVTYNSQSSTDTFSITFSTLSIMSASYYIKCTGFNSTSQKSNSFTVSIICGQNSVIVKESSTFISSYQFYFGYQESLIFNNFTSNDTRCSIQSHQIVVSLSDNSNPSAFQLIEGSQKQQINYILSGGSQYNYTFYLLATASGGTQNKQQMQISIQCGPNSVTIGTPTAFRQTQYFQIGQQSTFIYNNFTLNDSRCPIIKHSLIESQSNQSTPSQFNITQGNTYFSINYILNGGSPKLYNLFIKIQALGGSTMYKQIFIQSMTYYDCSQDTISMLQTMQDKSNSNYKLFSIINTYPTLILNQSLGKSFSADISSRYQNVYGLNCPLNFNIQQVKSQENIVSSSDYNNIFKLSSSGIFQISANADQPINNYQVYIQVCNSKICFSDLLHYILDITLFKKIIQVTNITYNKIHQGNNPYFVDDPLNITINIAKTVGNFINYLPLVSNDTSSVIIMQTSQGQTINILYNKNRLNASLIFYQINLQSESNAFVLVRLKNDLGLTADYNITVNYIYFNPKNVSATIKNINQIGQMTIYFNESMMLNQSIPCINYLQNQTVQFNNSWINSSNTNIYIEPANHRDQYPQFNKSQIELNWNVISLTNWTIQIQLNFTNPIQISPLMTQDKIIVQFNGSQNLLMSSNTKQNLHPQFWTLSSPILKQMSNDQSTQTFLSTIEQGQTLILTLLILGIVFNFLGGKVIDYMRLMIRSLQLILHLPIMEVSLPANVVVFINGAISFVMFDIFFNKTVWAYLPFIYFNNDIQPQAMNQMQNVGYSYRNAFQGLAAITFFIFLYFFRLFLSIDLKIMLIFTNKQKSKLGKWIQKYYLIISKGIFFNQILGLSLEAYIEFYINSILNIQTTDLSTNGECLGIFLSYFCATMIHLVIPSLMIFILTRSVNELLQTSFSECFGELYENTKIDSRVRQAYTLIFIIRRGLYLTIGMFILNPNLGGLQIVFLMLLNLLAIVYIGYSAAQKSYEFNFIEFINEIFVQAATIHLVFYTDFVQDLDAQFMYGWYMIGCISFVFVFNFYFIFREILRLQFKYILKYFYLINFHYNKYLIKFQNSLINNAEDSQKQMFLFKLIVDKNCQIFQQNQTINLKTLSNSSSKKVQDISQNEFDTQQIAQMIFSKQIIDKSIIQIKYSQDIGNYKIQSIIKTQTSYQNKIKNMLNQDQIQINFGILQLQRKFYKEKTKEKKQNQKKLTKQQLQEDRKDNLKIVRNKRLYLEKNNEIIEQDKCIPEYKQILEKYEYILESCSSKFNSFEDLKRDIYIFAIAETDSVEQLALKEYQIKEFIHNLVLYKSTLQKPFIEIKKFEKDLSNFIELKIQFD